MFLYSSAVMCQTVLLSMHTSLTEVNIPYLNYGVLTVLFQLFPFSFLEELVSYLVFQEDVGDLFAFKPHDLESLNASQKNSILSQNFTPELLQVLQLLFFLFLLYKPSLLSFLSCFDLSHISCFLSSMLKVVGLYCLFQVNLEPLLLFISPLYFLVLLFKHIDVVLENIRGNEERYDNTDER